MELGIKDTQETVAFHIYVYSRLTFSKAMNITAEIVSALLSIHQLTKSANEHITLLSAIIGFIG